MPDGTILQGISQKMVPPLRRTLVTTGLVGFIASPALRRHPYLGYRWLQRLEPMHESPLGLWVLSRHAEVSAALRHPMLGSDESKADLSLLRTGGLERVLSRGHRTAEERGPFQQMFSRLMLFRDPPDHVRLRSLVAKAFTPRRAEGLAPRIAELVDEILDRVESNGHIELMSELAYPLPARVICELLGVPRADEEIIVAQAPALAIGLDPSPMRTASAVAAADQAATTIADYLDGLIAARRARPTDDLLSALIGAEEEGARLDHDELVATAMLLLIAGHETTANLIGNGMLALLRHPDELERLRRDPDLDRSAVEELLRFDSPVQMVQRIALDDVEIGGGVIPKGHIVVLCTGAANRDPSVFAGPDQLDLSRHPNPHLAFGGGPHFCIGAPLARIEARLVLGPLVRRFPALHFAGRAEHWRPSFTIRGLRELRLAW